MSIELAFEGEKEVIIRDFEDGKISHGKFIHEMLNVELARRRAYEYIEQSNVNKDPGWEKR